MDKIEVRINAEAFGEVFAHASSDEQCAILFACLGKVKAKWPIQLDYICIEVGRPENAELRKLLTYLVAEPPPAPADLALAEIRHPEEWR